MTTATMVQQASALLSSLSTDAESLLAQLSSTFPLDSQSGATGGHSLLGLKNLTMVSYLHHLILLCSLQLSGPSASEKSSLSERRGDIVDNLIRQRLVLEKMRPMEARIKGHIEGLLRAATSSSANAQDRQNNDDEGEGAADVDPLSFRPNLASFDQGPSSQPDRRSKTKKDSRPSRNAETDDSDGIYRPPRLAPVAYDENYKSKRKGAKERPTKRSAALLADLSSSLSANPYEMSSSGVGVGSSGREGNSSSRAKALARMQAYEEDNFTRLAQSKKDAKRRRRDEEDVALGGAGLSSKRGRVGAGLEEEFGDLLRGSSRGGSFEGARRKGALQRSRDLSGDGGGGADVLAAPTARGRKNTFEKKMKHDSRRKQRR
ncbi:hypothetical protein FA10DRAFT_280513 [Acaromyces ingoldii]|uniref:Uncharacterized protein n=1 Tax=Acaromyces ingoldii TaxID=215250 RepID=A0A316YL38_9BASI|nr:hypothetical protein FA10DRAFT_280513 [Acaromyces ingoldii]PWN89524.1 hypothetical protein FA10DRAFT_280513 [Acaromyces ingoldii]